MPTASIEMKFTAATVLAAALLAATALTHARPPAPQPAPKIAMRAPQTLAVRPQLSDAFSLSGLHDVAALTMVLREPTAPPVRVTQAPPQGPLGRARRAEPVVAAAAPLPPPRPAALAAVDIVRFELPRVEAQAAPDAAKPRTRIAGLVAAIPDPRDLPEAVVGAVSGLGARLGSWMPSL